MKKVNQKFYTSIKGQYLTATKVKLIPSYEDQKRSGVRNNWLGGLADLTGLHINTVARVCKSKSYADFRNLSKRKPRKSVAKNKYIKKYEELSSVEKDMNETISFAIKVIDESISELNNARMHLIRHNHKIMYKRV